MTANRREFIRTALCGCGALAAGSAGITSVAHTRGLLEEPSTVSFAYGGDRRKMIMDVLEPLEREIRAGVQGKQVIIKPNCVWDDNRLCATHPDAIRGVLDFLKPFYKDTVVIAESTASDKGTMKCFEDYEYTKVAKEYDTELMDLNLQPYAIEWILDKNRHPLDIKIIEPFLNPNNYIISLARMKTHGSVVVTLAMKNMVMASPLNVPAGHKLFVKNQFEKAKMHEGGMKGINYNMYLIAHKVRPELAIIDGFVGMEGNGPRNGSAVEHGVALAGTDVVAVDRMGIELMNLNYEDVGYLRWCANAGIGQGDLSKIRVLGSDYKPYIKRYRLADNHEKQMLWKEKDSDS